MTDNKRLARQLAFALEIDKEKNIFRQTHLSGRGRNENDAEHAWHMAIMAYLLREYANEEVDIGRVMLMCLIHDIVEIDAGDTYAYDEEGLATQKEREDAAKERIFSLLPDDQKQELIALFDEFENSNTPESRYAHAMDNLQPLILNDSNEGRDWLEHRVCAKQIYKRQGKTRLGSEILYDYTDKVIQKHRGLGHIAAEQDPESASHQKSSCAQVQKTDNTRDLNKGTAAEEIYGKEEIDRALSCGIVHYNGAKPWKEACPNMDIWWDCYRRSIFFDERFCRDFWVGQRDSLEKLSLLKRLKLLLRYPIDRRTK